MSAIPLLTAPARTLGINDASTTATTTNVFHDILQVVPISQKTVELR